MKELLSVIITAYNVEQYLEQCIESVLHQSYIDIEIIVVNDGSDDNSSIIIDRFASKNPRIKVIHKKNEGVIKARYDGIRIANGDFVTFVDGDDWIEPDMYTNLMESLLKNNADMIASGIIRYYSDSYKKFEKNIIEAGYYNKFQIIEHIIPNMLWDLKNDKHGIDPSLCTKIFNCHKLFKSMCKLIQEKYEFHYGEDIAILYPFILNIDSIVISDQKYYYHRQRRHNELANYITDENYLEKLFDLYKYLKGEFYSNKNLLIEQLDYFYINSVNIRKKCYNELAETVKYMFPFDRITKGSKIVLYGAGVVGNTFYNQLLKLNYCKVILWVDKNYLNYSTKNVDIKSVSDILTVEYDHIVICSSTKEISDCIKQELIEMGIEQDIIV